MNLKICWMYHDLMDLYGDKGNIQVLKIRAQKRNIECIVDTCSLKEEKDLSAYDLLFIGGGADKEQSLLVEDLLSRKENIRKAMDEGSFILLICGGYQLFGQYYLDGDGNKIEGLGFFDYYTESASRDVRCIGNIAIEVNVEGEKFACCRAGGVFRCRAGGAGGEGSAAGIWRYGALDSPPHKGVGSPRR